VLPDIQFTTSLSPLSPLLVQENVLEVPNPSMNIAKSKFLKINLAAQVGAALFIYCKGCMSRFEKIE